MRIRRRHYRQRVNEQADLLFNPTQFRWTPCHRGAECYGGLPGVVMQQQQPCALHQGIEGHLVTLGEGFEVFGLRDIEAQAMLAIDRQGRIHLGVYGAGQARGLLQVDQLRLPERLADGFVLRLQPSDVVTIPPGRRWQRLTRILLQYLAEQLRTTPAIHQNMVIGVDQVIACRPRAYQRQAQQRCLLQDKALGPCRLGQFIQGLVAVLAGLPIQRHERQAHLLVDHLQRLFKLRLPDKTAAQDLVALHRHLPGLLEARHIQALHINAHLVDVVTRTFAVQRLEQHALLHG